MTNPSDANSRKCFPAILRRLLCSGSLPTHPSDEPVGPNTEQIIHRNHAGELKSLKNDDDHLKQSTSIPSSSPGVVAKLMGLDSFPGTPSGPKDRTLGSFFRSRSASSIDFLSHFDPARQCHHRRVRSSVSFRVINGDCYSENAGEYEYDYDEQGLIIGRRSANNHRENLKDERVARKVLDVVEKRRSGNENATSISQKKDFLHGKTRESLKERRGSAVKGVSCKDELLMGRNCVKRKKKMILAHKVHSRCSLKKVHPEGSVPEVSPVARSRKPRLPRIDNTQSPCPDGANSDNKEVIVRANIIKDKAEVKMKNKEISSCYYKRMVEQICGATEEDVKENWILKFEDFEDICQQFGHEILEVLLRQFVDELVCGCGTRN